MMRNVEWDGLLKQVLYGCLSALVKRKFGLSALVKIKFGLSYSKSKFWADLCIILMLRVC